MAATAFRKAFLAETDCYLQAAKNPNWSYRFMYLHRIVKEAQRQLSNQSWASVHGSISFRVHPERAQEREFLHDDDFYLILVGFLGFSEEDNVDIHVDPSNAFFRIRRKASIPCNP